MTKYLTPMQVEEIYGITRNHLAQLRFTGRGGPRYFKPTPKRIFYSAEDIDSWIEASARNSTAEAS
ncbi:hypothetical protein DEI81_07960 [Curtobacterium sp. MCBD17_013]|uniref:helix-turn-helix transcriptional regulator n=1 Tax=Curtobacterium sp. MCBD17_013 TaxID=2175668 RepID=UPI000DA7EC5D|nr:hypothetical protein [Curtobacterium sp. MCBD17_013]PZF63332.1 hypothetical protein DEI81_07960 [Curtobacterium sp. MCBD17_013]